MVMVDDLNAVFELKLRLWGWLFLTLVLAGRLAQGSFLSVCLIVLRVVAEYGAVTFGHLDLFQ